MPIVLNGSGTVTGISVGGLPDGIVDGDTLASGVGGKVLQVVQSQKVDQFSHTGTTHTKITGTDQSGSGSVFCVKITPSSSSNKVLVSCQLMFAVSLISSGRLVRTISGSDTVLSIGTDIGYGQTSFHVRSSATDHYYGSMPVNLEFLDTPNTTSEVQYSIEVRAYSSSHKAYINRTHTTNSVNYSRSTASTITAKEVSA
tara:strand:+ start:362 stop:961 length:600 start_codon:yes stop_codon:yes gene_type:complete